MLKVLFLCLSGLCGCLCQWTYKLATRLHLLYLISSLEAVKRVEVLKAKKHFLKRNRTLLDLLNPLELANELIANVTTFFVSDQYPGYLKLMLVKGTREENLLKMTAFFITGLLTATTFYLIQTMALQRMDPETLAFSLLVLAIVTIGPLVTMYGKVLSLLLIPISLTVILRALLVTTLLEDVQRVALANINDNFDRTLQTISCDRRAVVSFVRRIDFNWKVGDRRGSKQGGQQQATFDVNLGEAGDPLHAILVTLDEFKETSDHVFRLTMYAMNGVVQSSKSLTTFLGDGLTNVVNGTGFADWLRANVFSAAGDFVESVQAGLKTFGAKLYGIMKDAADSVIDGLKDLGGQLKKGILESFSVRYRANYNFTTTTTTTEEGGGDGNDGKNTTSSNSATSLRKLLTAAKDRLLERHTWLLVLKRLLSGLIYSWLLVTFFRVFSGPLSYLVLYLTIANYDNLYLTPAFYAYEREQQARGAEPLMPLFLFETALFVPRTGAALNGPESTALAWALLFDGYVALYTAALFGLDWAAYQAVTGVRRLTGRLAEDLVEPSLTLAQSDVPLLGRLLTVGGDGGKLLSDIAALRAALAECSPRESPLDWAMYRRAAWLLAGLLLLTLVWPYARRSRSAIADAYFPGRRRTRAAWLYGTITLQRIVFRAIVNLVMPQAKVILFQKAGQVNPLQGVPLEEEEEEAEAELRRRKQLKQRTFFLCRYWPFSTIGRTLGCIAADPKQQQQQCIQCPKVVHLYPPLAGGDGGGDGVRCPNTAAACDAVYCLPCYSSLRRGLCTVCRAEIRDAAERLAAMGSDEEDDDDDEEEVDSSADEWDGL